MVVVRLRIRGGIALARRADGKQLSWSWQAQACTRESGCRSTRWWSPMWSSPSVHGKASILKSLIADIRAALQHLRLTAEHFKTKAQRAG